MSSSARSRLSRLSSSDVSAKLASPICRSQVARRTALVAVRRRCGQGERGAEALDRFAVRRAGQRLLARLLQVVDRAPRVAADGEVVRQLRRQKLDVGGAAVARLQRLAGAQVVALALVGGHALVGDLAHLVVDEAKPARRRRPRGSRARRARRAPRGTTARRDRRRFRAARCRAGARAPPPSAPDRALRAKAGATAARTSSCSEPRQRQRLERARVAALGGRDPPVTALAVQQVFADGGAQVFGDEERVALGLAREKADQRRRRVLHAQHARDQRRHRALAEHRQAQRAHVGPRDQRAHVVGHLLGSAGGDEQDLLVGQPADAAATSAAPSTDRRPTAGRRGSGTAACRARRRPARP